MIRVLVADDHPVVRVGVRMELEKTEDVAVVGEAGSGAEVLRLARELVPDVLLLDMAMPDLDGVAVASQLRETHPSVRVLVFSGYIDDAFVFGALRAGAVGYLLKDEMLEQLGDAVRQAMAGKIVLSDRVAKKTVDRAVTERLAQESPMSLTDRELEVVMPGFFLAGAAPTPGVAGNDRVVRQVPVPVGIEIEKVIEGTGLCFAVQDEQELLISHSMLEIHRHLTLQLR